MSFRSGAQCDTNADFTCALQDRGREDPVDPHPREQERGCREARQEQCRNRMRGLASCRGTCSRQNAQSQRLSQCVILHSSGKIEPYLLPVPDLTGVLNGSEIVGASVAFFETLNSLHDVRPDICDFQLRLVLTDAIGILRFLLRTGSHRP